ncbi:hypothetical protein M5C72_01865 [Companilactobacillus allii]|uniref:DUF1659 domain-containing protein n=1 Tax=Companilactobacillus allii TaxID=1847728 RepID=A0A1P8Q252_9LACO|nr:hypothetical protein [Companilactobacillus allii]APX71911.1 hypothetical protein BTM29_04780 [Companilactobacillus allii]USQ69004.1 hypothetical protein M5C72_01865 [Companilactobacillus allii]
MNWNKTTINMTMANENYTDGKAVRGFQNIVKEPTPEQLKTFAGVLETLSNGDIFLKAEVVQHTDM